MVYVFDLGMLAVTIKVVRTRILYSEIRERAEEKTSYKLPMEIKFSTFMTRNLFITDTVSNFMAPLRVHNVSFNKLAMVT